MRADRPIAFVTLFALVAAWSVAAQQGAAVSWRSVAAGVEHAHIVRTSTAGDAGGLLSIHALRIDLARARLDVVHALDSAVGLETVSSMAQRHGAIAAVNGGYFRTTGTFRGDSTGTLQIDGRVLSEPDRGRAAVGFTRDAKPRLIFGHVAWQGMITAGSRKRKLDGVNRARGANELVLFIPQFHQTTLTDASGTEVTVRGGRVERLREAAGSTPIPADGFVISATGTARQWVRDALKPRTRVSVSVALEPVSATGSNPWTQAEDILGAGPKLVTAGRIDITTEGEKMLATFATDRHPRTAVASLADGRALLVVVDGRQLTSVGMSLDELARLLIELGAIEAINLDGGGSTTMVVQDKVVNSPSDSSGERPVSDAIIVRPLN